MASPLHQFEITPLIPLHAGGVDLSFTNSSLFMVLAVGAVAVFFIQGMSGRALVPGRWQSMAELTFEFVASMVRENVGHEGRKYFPAVLTLFSFILFCNLLGLLPYSFTVTSHIIVTFALALVVFIAVTVVGLVLHGVHFLKLFVPSGVSPILLPLLIPIEIISYLSRPVSLSVRLFANMMAGHTMMKVFAGFILPLGVFGIAPLAIDVVLTGFEFGIAAIQAYIFTVLTCLYLHDAVHLH
ncbi:MAG: F0F1 ATP synthase subunit A [Rhodospirillales bacterium]|nr:MAG: F0F1 ATP synthase subunit A [Rhodospirillales bacterium]